MLELVREHTASRTRAPVHVNDDDGWGLDKPHQALWDAVRHLFPPEAMVDQVDHGCLLISWPLRSLRGSTHFAAPIVIRVASGLLLALWTCGRMERREIASLQVETVKQALSAYDPYSRMPTCGVIELGD